MKPFIKSITKHWVVLVILLLIAAVALQVMHLIFPGFISSIFEPWPLSASQVGTLREKYPEMPHVFDPTIEVKPFNLQYSIKGIRNAYVLVEVVERLDDSSRLLSLSPFGDVDPALVAEKEKNLGYSLPDIRVQQDVEDYRIRVLDIFYQGDGYIALDPVLALAVGQVIEVRACVSNENVCESPLPDMPPDGLFVMGITIEKQDFSAPAGYQFSSRGLYYVVDGTHVISAYQEREPYVYSGLSLPAFKRTVQEIRNTQTEMDDQIRKARESRS